MFGFIKRMIMGGFNVNSIIKCQGELWGNPQDMYNALTRKYSKTQLEAIWIMHIDYGVWFNKKTYALMMEKEGQDNIYE